MEQVSIFMRLGWVLWFLVAAASLFFLVTGRPHPKYVREVSRLYGETIAQTALSVVYILLLTKEVAPKVVTADTRWLFMIAPWVGFILQGMRLPKIVRYTIPKR